jgi:hypothetical protein
MAKFTFDKRYAYGGAVVAAVGVLGIGQAILQNQAEAQEKTVEAPRFEVDPYWPKPLPNHWLLGSAIGVWVDAEDHIWMIHRGADTLADNENGMALDPPRAPDCCQAAPPVLVFDQEGNLLKYWGGPGEGYEWPDSNHGIHVDYKGNVWIGGNGGDDAHILKFTQDGQFLLQVGHHGQTGGSNDPLNFGRVAKIWVDPDTNEAYIADGYGNRRVAVLDADTGEMKRFWGAYGNVPDDTDPGPYDPSAPPPQQFRNPVHCVEKAVDGLIYVCDRQADRLQIFQPDGTFVKEQWYQPETLGSGSVWDIAFSPDPEQKYLYMSDGQNAKIRIIDRETLEVLYSFGDGGRQPGQFYGVHSIATDSQGNIYETETYEGKRIQRFIYKGIGQVPTGDLGAAGSWPQQG